MERKKAKKIFLIISAILLVLSIVCIRTGIDKKENYYNSDYSSLNVNAYVGGDAYNYIINAGYFAGYFALAGGCLTSSAVLFSAGMMLAVKEAEKETVKAESVSLGDTPRPLYDMSNSTKEMDL